MARHPKRELIHNAATQAAAVDTNVAKPQGLRRRGGSWEMRVRTPARLRSVLPTEIIKSFGGVSAAEANRLGWIERANIERRFAGAEVLLGISTHTPPPAVVEAPALSEEQLIEIAKRYLRELEASGPTIPLDEREQQALIEATTDEVYYVGRPNAVEDATLQKSAEGFAQRIGIDLPAGPERFEFYEAMREAEIEHLTRRLERLRGATVATVNPAFTGVDGGQYADEVALTVSEAVDLYMSAPERSANTDSSRKMDRSRLGALRDILGGSRPVASITKGDMRQYAEQLMALPAHYTKRYPGKSPADAIKAGKEDNAATLSLTSIKRDIQAVRSFFTWLERQDLIGKNPALHLQGPRTPKKSERRPFTTRELRTLLVATAKTGKQELDWRYWHTRLTMLHGFRLTEPLGLKVGDLVEQDGIWLFRLRPNEFRTLKTEETARDIPVHPRLIALGILDLAKGRDPDELLIPGVPIGKGKAFNGAQKRMSRLIERSVSSDPNLVFHSLRHNFRDAMRDGGFPRGIEERLGGWKMTGGDAMDGYGRGYRLKVLNEWIVKVVYDGVEID